MRGGLDSLGAMEGGGSEEGQVALQLRVLGVI